MRTESPYRDQISLAIVELQENNNIQMFYNKWWKNSGTCNNDDKKQETASSLDISNVGGIFVVLFVGLTLAVFVAVIEFMWNARKTARGERVGGAVAVVGTASCARACKAVVLFCV